MAVKTYLDALASFPMDRPAVITREESLSFGVFYDAALKEKELAGKDALPVSPSAKIFRKLCFLRDSSTLRDLIRFFAFSGTRLIPVFVSGDTVLADSTLSAAVPGEACMGVLTSGTSGVQKLLFRSFESWYDFFPVQNHIFKMGEGTRCFFQGSPAFTGNLNLLASQLATGGTVLWEDRFDPRLWKDRIRKENADCIYLIPAKLRALLRAFRADDAPILSVRSIVSGSQSLGREDASALKKVFPNAEIFLYYGASELSYVTWLSDRDMGEDAGCIGRPFPGVSVRLDNDGCFLVTTPYGVIGIGPDERIGDVGELGADGLFYFRGRADDILNINGRKVSAVKIENALLSLPGIREAAVAAVEREDGRCLLTAFLAADKGICCSEAEFRKKLRDQLAAFEIPRQYVFLNELPKNGSGKIVKHLLPVLSEKRCDNS